MYRKLDYITKKLLPSGAYKLFIGQWGEEGVRRYFPNTGWIFLTRITMMVISFVTTMYVARHLGPTNYGELSYSISFVGMFSFIAYLGLDNVLYRELAKYPEKRNVLLGTAHRIRIISALVASFLCITSAFFFSPLDISFFIIVMLCITFFFQTFSIILYEFQAAVDSKLPSILAAGITLILSLGKIIVIYLDKGVLFLALILVLESVLYASGYIYLRSRKYGSLRLWCFDKNTALQLLRDAWPLIFSTAFVLIYTRIDQVMLKNIMDASSVGIYDSAVRLTELWYFIPNILVVSFFPALINARKHSINEYNNRIKILMSLIILISVSVSVITYLISPQLVLLVFGPAFGAAVGVLQLYIWAFIPVSISILTNQILLAENATKTIFFAALLGMLINVVGNYLLIPDFGAVGAAIATLISSCIVSLLTIAVYVTIVANTRKLEPHNI